MEVLRKRHCLEGNVIIKVFLLTYNFFLHEVETTLRVIKRDLEDRNVWHRKTRKMGKRTHIKVVITIIEDEIQRKVQGRSVQNYRQEVPVNELTKDHVLATRMLEDFPLLSCELYTSKKKTNWEFEQSFRGNHMNIHYCIRFNKIILLFFLGSFVIIKLLE